MNFRQSTIGEIIESERDMILRGEERFGEYFINATDSNNLLNEFLVSINLDRFIFAIFLSQVRKHLTLAIFSTVRLHHTQAMMDIRQVLEAGACAAYAIANIDITDFADTNDQGIINPSNALTKKRYTWLKNNYKTGSDAIKRMKGSINNLSAHSNIVCAYKNFSFDANTKKFDTPFFDFEDEYHVKANLCMIGNIIIILMHLFLDVNRDRDVIKFADNFIPRLKILEKQSNKLKNEMKQTDQYKATQIN